MFLGFEKEFGSLDCQTLPIKFFFYFPLLRGRYACRKKNVFLEALKILLLVTTLVPRKFLTGILMKIGVHVPLGVHRKLQ